MPQQEEPNAAQGATRAGWLEEGQAVAQPEAEALEAAQQEGLPQVAQREREERQDREERQG